MSSSIAADPLLAEAERLDGAGALDGLGQRRVDRGVRRALAEVAVLGAGEVPPQRRSPAAVRRAGTAAPPTSRREIAATKVSTAVTTAIVHSGSAKRTDQPSWSTSRLVRVSRSPEPADSTTPDRQREGVARRSPRGARPAPARRAPARRSARSGSAPSGRRRNAASTSMIRSTWPTVVPSSTDCTRSPSSRGAASAASAAKRVQARAPSTQSAGGAARSCRA